MKPTTSRRDFLSGALSKTGALALAHRGGSFGPSSGERADAPSDSAPRAESVAAFVASRFAGAAVQRAELYRVSINHVYRVHCEQGTRWLRLSRAVDRSVPRVETELRVLARLTAAGLAAPRPIEGVDGHFCQRFAAAEGARPAALFEHVEGEQDWPSDPAASSRLGHTLGRMHALADTTGVRAPEHKDLHAIFVAPIEVARAELDEQGVGLDRIERIARALYRFCEPILDRGRAGTGFCHGDFHPGNVLWGRDGTVSILDFDWCFDGPRALDLGIHRKAIGLTSSLRGDLRDHQTRRWRAFLDGYRRARPISEEDETLARAMVLGHHIGFLSFAIRWREIEGCVYLTDRRMRRMAEFLALWIRELELPVDTSWAPANPTWALGAASTGLGAR